MSDRDHVDPDLLDRIPIDSATVLEIGGGSDRLAEAFRARSPLVRYERAAGPPATGAAGEPVDAVVCPDGHAGPDDPCEALSALRANTRPGGVCVMRVARAEDAPAAPGVRSPPAPATAAELLRRAGWTVADAVPGVMRAIHGPLVPPITVAALGLRKAAGVTDVRVDQPMTALRSLPGVRAHWSSAGLGLPPGTPPGVLVLHRQFVDDARMQADVERLIARGWVVVSDMDDDPRRWRRFADSDFRAYRGVHAVVVSTEPLARIVGQWNPEVRVFANAVFELPRTAPRDARPTGRTRVFFGALNRADDWAEIEDGVLAAARVLGDAVQFVVVHDREVHDRLPEGVAREFHPMLTHDRYMAVLASCDVALLPLRDTPFNRAKSDLKFIESCAAGVVPVCSPVVYAPEAARSGAGLVAADGAAWRDALLRLCGEPDLLHGLRRRGLEHVVRHRMQCHQAAERLAHYRDLLDRRVALEAARAARLSS